MEVDEQTTTPELPENPFPDTEEFDEDDEEMEAAPVGPTTVPVPQVRRAPRRRFLSRRAQDLLLAPFPMATIRFLPARGNGPQLAYLQEQDIFQRLTEAVGPDGWDWKIEEVQVFGDGAVAMCRGTLTVMGRERSGIGEGTNQGGGSPEIIKSAATDALKRAARLFGIGAYLKLLPNRNNLTDQDAAQAAMRMGWSGGGAFEGPGLVEGFRQGVQEMRERRANGQNTPATRPTDQQGRYGAPREGSAPTAPQAPTAGREVRQVISRRIAEAVTARTITPEQANLLTGRVNDPAMTVQEANQIVAALRGEAEYTPPQRQSAPPPPHTGPGTTPPGPNGSACEECGLVLTSGQLAMSQRNFGRALCPAHQRGVARVQ